MARIQQLEARQIAAAEAESAAMDRISSTSHLSLPTPPLPPHPCPTPFLLHIPLTLQASPQKKVNILMAQIQQLEASQKAAAEGEYP
ncbi:unnamed protein product [Closterium sp. NIES-54]